MARPSGLLATHSGASIVRRIPGAANLMQVDYTYFANGLPQSVTAGNGARTKYIFDAAGRVTVIDHRNDLGLSLLKLSYEYNNRDLPVKLTEEDALNVLARMHFTYDNRGRLIGERRTIALPLHDIEYTYDNGGNRLSKIWYGGSLVEVYTYDIDDPARYGSNNNRLMFVKRYSPNNEGEVIFYETTWYYYNDVGNVTRILTELEFPWATQSKYAATRLHYAANGVAVAFIVGERWDDGTEDSCPTNYAVDFAEEYYYDGP